LGDSVVSTAGARITEGPQELLNDPGWSLAQRIVASPGFQRSPRLRELFLYLCERALLGRPEDLREQSIGCRIFNRPADYNPSEDNIVRVEIRRLRKRIDEYFAAEGANEPVVISIPKGSYVPAFQPREEIVTAAPVLAAPALPDPAPMLSGRRRVRRTFVLGAAAAVLLACGALLWTRTSGAGAGGVALMSAAERPPLWPLLFNNDQETLIVCADSALVVAQTLRGGVPVQLEDYLRRNYTAGIAPSDELRRISGELAAWQMTDLADVRLVDRMHRTNPDAWSRTSVRTARTTQIYDFASQNVILLGSARSNPWNALFEKQLNFRIEWDAATQKAVVLNRQPRQGEPAVYQTATPAGTVEYGTIAFVPNLRHTGHVLIIAGTNGLATEAAGEYLTTARSYARLIQSLTGGKRGDLPYFEVLVKTGIVAGTPSEVEPVALRIKE